MSVGNQKAAKGKKFQIYSVALHRELEQIRRQSF